MATVGRGKTGGVSIATVSYVMNNDLRTEGPLKSAAGGGRIKLFGERHARSLKKPKRTMSWCRIIAPVRLSGNFGRKSIRPKNTITE